MNNTPDRDNTILTWTKDKNLIALVRKVAKELKLNMIEADNAADLIMLPFFFAIIDGEYMTALAKTLPMKVTLAGTEDINTEINWLTDYVAVHNPKEYSILLTSKSSAKIPIGLRKYFFQPKEQLTFDFIKTTILKKRKVRIQHRLLKKKRILARKNKRK